MSFSEETVERFRRATHQGLDRPPDALGMAGSYRKGHFVVIGLYINEDAIGEARFQSFNCLPSIASADWLCEVVEGRDATSALSITVAEISEGLGGIPKLKMFCVQLVHDALGIAVREAQKKGLLQ